MPRWSGARVVLLRVHLRLGSLESASDVTRPTTAPAWMVKDLQACALHLEVVEGLFRHQSILEPDVVHEAVALVVPLRVPVDHAPLDLPERGEELCHFLFEP